MIYLDNNATTRVCDTAKRAIIKYLQQCSNPSTITEHGACAAELIRDTKIFILKHLSVYEEGKPIGEQPYSIIITSGASESNSTILSMIVNAYWNNNKKMPHIITSDVEHSSIMKALKNLQTDNRVEVSYIKTNTFGYVEPSDLEKTIKNNTALITIMGANNVLGTINDIKTLADISHRYKIPFHSDVVQLFGKIILNLNDINLDAFSLSFHKFYGPMGLGLLVIRRSLINNFNLHSVIAGSQQEHLRGGTENVPYISAIIPTMYFTFKNRFDKNKKLMSLRHIMVQNIVNRFRTFLSPNFNENVGVEFSNHQIYILTPLDNSIYNTLLISIIRIDETKNNEFCNIKFVKLMEKHNIIVGIGSACDKDNINDSILNKIGFSDIILRGAVRISLSEYNTLEDIKSFNNTINKVLN